MGALPLLDPAAEITQCLMEHAEIAGRVSRVLLRLIVAMEGVIREPQAEMLVERVAQVRGAAGRAPIGMPREGLAIEKRLDHDHLSLEAPRLHGSGRCGGEQRPEQHRPLWVPRRSIRAPELVPHGVLPRFGHLMPVVGLGRQAAAVVNTNSIAGAPLCDGLGIAWTEYGKVAVDGEQSDPRSCRQPRGNIEVCPRDIDVRKA